MPPAIQAPLHLIYGNQAYSVNKAAQGYADAVLEPDAPLDFAFQRFDAAEMLKAGSADAVGDAIAEFQNACESAPFLCERWVVRLDHVEAVKISDRAAHNLERALGEWVLFPILHEGEKALALEEDLLASDAREGGGRPQNLVAAVESRSDGPPLLHFNSQAERLRLLLSSGGKRVLVDARKYLREKLKGKFDFAGEVRESLGGASSAATSPGAASPATSSPATLPSRQQAPRLHRLLERLADNPPPGLHLVMTAAASRESDLSRPLLTHIKKGGTVEKHVTYDDYEPVDWVLREARPRKLALTHPLAALLVHLAGNDLGKLAGEMDKLALLFPDGQAILEEDLTRTVGGGAVRSLFLITEKLGAKDLSGVLAVLEEFLGDTPGEHPMLIGILARYFRQLLHVHTLRALGVSEADYPSQLKLHPFIAKKVVLQAWKFDRAELEAIMRTLAELDLALKLHYHLTGPLLREFAESACLGRFARGRATMLTHLEALRHPAG